MARIACILPDIRLLGRARAALQRDYGDIRIEIGLLAEAAECAVMLAREGYEVFISRGRTAAHIRETGLEASVVEIPISIIDVIQTIERAKFKGKRIGVVAFTPMIPGIDYLKPILGGDVRFYPLEHEGEVEELVVKAKSEGADIIVGGAITGKLAQKHGLLFALVENSAESMLQAAHEANNISFARRQEKAKTNLFRAVLNYAYEGIISVDRQGRINFFNPVAERVLQISGAGAIGQPLRRIWPELDLGTVLESGQEDLGQVLNIKNDLMVCNKVPIFVNGRVIGAVTTFQEGTRLRQMEARVRQRLFASGHVAGFFFEDIVGTSARLRKSIALARDFSRTDSSILILGETGTGKEVFAQSIHNHSSRNQGPFVAINCAALPAQILESELFGYVGGAFTGANQKGKAGMFEIAHGGTLFLDEIAEMEYATQSKLLRVLQEKKVMRLGSDRVTPVNVRIIAATNKRLKSRVDGNTFRADLYYRLNVLQLRLYPLRERIEDIEPLARFFLDKHASSMGSDLSFTRNAIKELACYGWPGNIRELQNIVERILATLRRSKIDAEMVRQHLVDQHEADFRTQRLQDEFAEVRDALAQARGNRSEAAKLLGISRSTLWRKLKRMA